MAQFDDYGGWAQSFGTAEAPFVPRSGPAPAQQGTSIGVVDAQPLYRTGIVQALRAHGQMNVVAEGQTARDALQMAGRSPLDILLLDLAIAGGGMQLLANLSHNAPALKLVLLTTSEREEDVTGALNCGASGYILKHVKADELVTALKAIANGEVYLTPSLGARLIARSAASSTPPVQKVEGLTVRENEILSHVAIGATNKEIARKLNITEKTVKHYMTAIMQKLHVRNRVEAVVLMRSRTREIAQSA